jgi:predicted ATPase/DNA-binding winged helix-turn-helix (wHTH) protein
VSAPTTSPERAISFGSFRFLPEQQLLLESETPVRLGSRALEILKVLVERPGELISKTELTARVWPDTFVDENTLRVHVAGLRKALGDGQPGRRYLANAPGRGYRFVAPVELSEPAAPLVAKRAVADRFHNLPISQSRAVGRAELIGSLLDRLSRQRFITIVGAGGIGKTTVALALAEALLPAYQDGVRFVDLAPVGDPQLVTSALGTTLGLAVHSEDAVPRLIDFLRDKQLLIVLDSCEHVVEPVAILAEQLLAGAPGVHILATSREPLRAEGERVHRLPPLECPAASTDLTAAEALASPAVRLFVERAAAILDGFELSDADAPIVADICRKLGGVALAIELAAARVDAFGIGQLSVLLDDRFRILKRGKRTAQPRHQSLAAALDWSYEFLPEAERIVLCRLSVFAGAFTLSSAIAVAGDDDTDAVESVAQLVAKSLISADVGAAAVQYRLLDTTRAYAAQKLSEGGELDGYARRHAQHHVDWFKHAESAWERRSVAEWFDEYGRRLDDVRSALNWAFSPAGDTSVGVALTIGAIPLWRAFSLVHEARERVERALASQAAQPTHNERDELKLLEAFGTVQPHSTRRVAEDDDLLARTEALAEKLGDDQAQARALFQWSASRWYAEDFREALALAEKCSAIADKTDDALVRMMGKLMLGNALHSMGEYALALSHIDSVIDQSFLPNQLRLSGYRLVARFPLSNILWLKGFPDQAVACARIALDEARRGDNALVVSQTLARASCLTALHVGDLAEAESSVAVLLSYSAEHALNTWNAVGRCLHGRLLLAQGDFAGLAVLRAALDWLHEARFGVLYTMSLGALAQGLGAAGWIAEGRAAIDQALERVDRSEERWCMAELLRIKGELLRSDGLANADMAAESCFQQALGWARRQGALSWELRAATSLAKLWHQQEKTAEAHDQLAAVYNRFTEGFETADLKAARVLMDELRGRAG